MKKILIVILLLSCFLTGCSLPFGNNKTDSDSYNSDFSNKIKYYPTSDSEYKTVQNDVFDFWFDMPKAWKVALKSDQTGEFFIVSDNDKVILKVYGIVKDGTDKQMYEKLAGTGGKSESFTFRDGVMGEKITTGNSEVYYLRSDNDTYDSFYIDYSGNSEWYEDNEPQLNYIAESLRIYQESFGKDFTEKSKITLDDLQLGDIPIDMTYDKLIKTMTAKLLKEDSDGVGKTLLFSDDTQIYISNGNVSSMNVISKDYATPRGLRVGNDMDRVRNLYGEPDNINDATHWGYTLEGYELFTIVFKDGKVVEMQIDMVM